MLSGVQSRLDKLVVLVRADDDEVNRGIREEVVGRPVVLGLGEVHRAMAHPQLCAGVLRGWRRALEEGVYLELWVGQDVWQVEAFCGEAVAYDSDLDGRHVFLAVFVLSFSTNLSLLFFFSSGDDKVDLCSLLQSFFFF